MSTIMWKIIMNVSIFIIHICSNFIFTIKYNINIWRFFLEISLNSQNSSSFKKLWIKKLWFYIYLITNSIVFYETKACTEFTVEKKYVCKYPYHNQKCFTSFTSQIWNFLVTTKYDKIWKVCFSNTFYEVLGENRNFQQPKVNTYTNV